MNNRSQLGWLLLGGLIFRLIIATFLPPGFDEAYYFLYVRHLDWSYFDHPIAVALTTGIGVWLTGVVSPLTIRLGALGLFTLSLWLLYETGRSLFDAKSGWIAAAIASLSPLFFLTCGTLTAPDNALIFFWSLTLYLCAQEFFPGDDRPYRPTPKLVLIALAVGLACLSKYHGFLLGLSLVGFCLTSADYRVVFRSRWLWLGLGAYGLTLLPLLYWNSLHEWISFRFHLGDRFSSETAHYSILNFILNFLGVFLAQIAFLFPAIGLPLWWVSLRQITKADTKTSFLLWAGLPVAAGFTLLGGLTHTFPAWPVPGLWSLSLLLGKSAAAWPHRQIERWLTSTGLIVASLLLIALGHISLGTLQKPGQYAIFGGLVSPSQDPSTELIDTGQLGQQFRQSSEFQAALAQTDFVVTHEYWLSGYLAMALANSTDIPVTSFTPDPRGHAFWFHPQDWLGKDALFISFARSSQAEMVSALAPYFQSVTPLTELSIQRGGVITETFYVYRAKRLIHPYPYPYGP